VDSFLRRGFSVFFEKSHDLLAFHIGCLSRWHYDEFKKYTSCTEQFNRYCHLTNCFKFPIHYIHTEKNASSFIFHMTIFFLLHTSPPVHGFTHITHFIFTIRSCLVWNLRPFWFNVCLFMLLRHVFIWIELYGKKIYIHK